MQSLDRVNYLLFQLTMQKAYDSKKFNEYQKTQLLVLHKKGTKQMSMFVRVK